MNSYDETPWWCQLLWPWFGPPWYAEIEDPDAFWARSPGSSPGRPVRLAGDDRPGEGYLAKAGRLTAAHYQAEEIIRHEYGPLTSDEEDNGTRTTSRPVRGTAGGDRARPSVVGGGRCRAAGTARRSARRGRPAMTALANSPAFWIGLLAALAALYVLPEHDLRDQACREHRAGGVLELLPDRLAGRAGRGMHDATQG